MQRSAEFSTDSKRTYRYRLGRVWDESKKQVLFIALNPSTADEKDDDKTTTHCINFAKWWHNGSYGSLVVCNLFAFRATYPRNLKAADEPIGAENDCWLRKCAKEADLVVAAWGNDGTYKCRHKAVRKIMEDIGVKLHCLAENKSKGKQPRHPLYSLKSSEPNELK